MPQISESTEKLISYYQNWHQSLRPKEEITTIHVDEVASKVAAFYEKIRTIVDWKEEHLMRRSAIIRKLKRKFLNLELNGEKELPEIQKEVAESLILELIRGGHFPNDRIEEIKILEVQKIINKYVFILKDVPEIKNKREQLQFYNWILEIAACEIEETISPLVKEKGLINYMFELMKKRIRVNEGVFKTDILKEEEKNIQIYIAVQQALFKLDHPIISYNLLKYKFPYWTSQTKERFPETAKNIYKIWKDVEKDLTNHLGKKFYTICEKYDTPYLLLGDILSEEKKEIIKEISNPETLETLTKKAYEKRLSTLKHRLFRAAFYTTLSVLLGNGLSLFLIEIPLARLIHGRFTPLSIVVDIFESTLLMFLFVATVKLPSKTNLSLV